MLLLDVAQSLQARLLRERIQKKRKKKKKIGHWAV
jgi:hypothetical protein